MKNILEKQKKPASSGKKELVWILLIAAVCIIGTFTVTKALYRSPDVVPEQEGDLISVAMTNAEVGVGETVADKFVFTRMPLKQVPENAIFVDSNITGKVSSIKLLPNTVITSDMLVQVDMDEIQDDTCRQVAVNYVTIASNVVEGSFIDVRMKSYSTDELAYTDEVVLAKKKILAVESGTIYLNLSEDEQLRLGIAAVDTTMRNSNDGTSGKSILYATAYANAAQSRAIVTYANEKLRVLLETNPQLISQAQKDLADDAPIVPEEPVLPETEIIPE